ncbi:MAG TPA: hypothetical protein PLS94_03140 [Prolixibacteraceae bacterium]|nr:hypothetical protein [Prolixibacteraceae bacterium]
MKGKANISITLELAAILCALLSFVLPKNDEKYLSEYFWSRKTLSKQKYNMVIMGDSRVYRGVSPQIMQKHLPQLKILNFGYSNGGLNPTMFNAAEQKLATTSSSKIIVMGITANSISAYTEKNLQYTQELTRPREEVIERLYFSPIKYWFSPVTPQILKTWLFEPPPVSYYINEYHLNGYVRSEKFPVDTMEAIPSYVKDFTNYKVDGEKLEALYKQVSEWNKKGIVVVGFRPPISYPMCMLEDTMGLYNEAEIEANMNKAGAHWLKLDCTRFKTYDGSHLDEYSAVQLSDTLAKYVQYLLL